MYVDLGLSNSFTYYALVTDNEAFRIVHSCNTDSSDIQQETGKKPQSIFFRWWCVYSRK
jgi:hypothetical protein